MTTRAAFLLQNLYSGTPADKLVAARRLHTNFVSRPPDAQLASALAKLQEHSKTLATHMCTLNLGALCTACASRPNGGCCSALMADNVDAVLLLMNLLLGCDVHPVGTDPASCQFLGARGCVLAIKPIFCLNYNCRAILDTTPAAGLDTLYRCAATVLSQQTQVEELLLANIHQPKTPATETTPSNPPPARSPAC